MRLIRFRHGDGTVHTAVRQGLKVRDLGAHNPLAPITGEQVAAAPLLDYERALEVPLPAVGKLFAWQEIIASMLRSQASPDPRAAIWTPQIFWKPSSTLLRPGSTVALRAKNVFFDWEAELAVVIGKQARDVKPEDAMQYVFGYTIVNDLSERKYNADIAQRDKREFDPFSIG